VGSHLLTTTTRLQFTELFSILSLLSMIITSRLQLSVEMVSKPTFSIVSLLEYVWVFSFKHYHAEIQIFTTAPNLDGYFNIYSAWLMCWTYEWCPFSEHIRGICTWRWVNLCQLSGLVADILGIITISIELNAFEWYFFCIRNKVYIHCRKD